MVRMFRFVRGLLFCSSISIALPLLPACLLFGEQGDGDGDAGSPVADPGDHEGDGGSSDSGTLVPPDGGNSGDSDGGTRPVLDSGVTSPGDGGMHPMADGGQQPVDGGEITLDSGMHLVDSGVEIVDSGLHVMDSGVGGADAGMHAMDAGAPPGQTDAGGLNADAGQADGGVVMSDPWDDLRQAIDDSVLENVTLLIGNEQGSLFEHSKGSSTPTTVYALASASKLLSAITILALVDDDVVALDDSFQSHLSWWTIDSSDPRSDITMEQLLSFTSGFAGSTGLGGDPNGVACVEDGDTTLDACAEYIYQNLFDFDPGTTFYYGPSHLQIAGAAASAITGETFNRLWRQQIANPLSLPLSAGYFSPSLQNPRVGGGGSASGAAYGSVLTALMAGELLSQSSMALLVSDHTPSGVVIENIPEAANSWHYALGCWRECLDVTMDPECDDVGVISSPGAFGFYPWWDQARGFWGVLATFLPEGGAGVTVPIGQQWADLAATAIAQD